MSVANSLDAGDLAALERDWAELSARRAKDGDREFEREVSALAKRVVAHRAKLFDANAKLQASSSRDDDPAILTQTESNQDAIKACTTLLNDLTYALGRQSIPAR